MTAGVGLCVAQSIGGDSLCGCLTDGSGGLRKGSVRDPLLTVEEGAGVGVEASACVSSWARRVGGDSAAIPSIHCPRTNRSSLASGDRQLLCLDSAEGAGKGRASQAGSETSVFLPIPFQNHLWHPQLCGPRSAAETGSRPRVRRVVPGLCHVSPGSSTAPAGAWMGCTFRFTPAPLVSALQVHTAVWESPL